MPLPPPPLPRNAKCDSELKRVAAAPRRSDVSMPWSHLCVKSPRMSHVLKTITEIKTNYGTLTRMSTLVPRNSF